MLQHILQRHSTLSACGVLLVWLLLAGLALAEQVDVLIETSSHDEQALSALVLAIKPGATSTDGTITCIPIMATALTLVEPARSSIGLLGLNRDKPDSLLLSRANLPLFIALSCYRV